MARIAPAYIQDDVSDIILRHRRLWNAVLKGVTMHSIAIRQIDSALKNRLRLEAARQGCSMEEQARRILRGALPVPSRKPAGQQPGHGHLVHRIQARFAAAGGVELQVPPRSAARAPVKF